VARHRSPPGHPPRDPGRVVAGCSGMAGRIPRRPEFPARCQHPADPHRRPTRRARSAGRLS